MGNLANARANANATGTLQRGHGSEERNPPWLLWSCCDVEIFADILPILFGYGLEMSEKKTGVSKYAGREVVQTVLGWYQCYPFLSMIYVTCPT